MPGTSLCSNCRAKVKLKRSLIKTKFKRCLTRSRSKPLVSKGYLQPRLEYHLSNFKNKLLTNRFGVSVRVFTLWDQRVTSTNFLNIYAYLREKVMRSKKLSPKRKRFYLFIKCSQLIPYGNVWILQNWFVGNRSPHTNFLTFYFYLYIFFQVQTIIPRIVQGKGQIVSDKTREKFSRKLKL